MADKGTRATDREFSSLKRSVKRVYQQAYHEVAQKAADFAKAHEERAAKYQQMVKDGKMTQADYDAWLRGQVFQGQQWKARVEQMAQSLYRADQTAMAMQNKARMNVFAQNANAITREISNDIHSQVNFTLYDANTVQRLVQKQPDVLPPRKVGRDKAYQWYRKQMNNVLQQGIVQGESIQDIALRIGKECSESCLTSMLRNARTGFTGAQNAGRMEGLKQAKEMGINVKKQWMATPDARTRDTHAELDGEIVDVDEPFITSAGNEIMYPGDPMAAPEEVWNCRCTLVYVYPDYDELEKPEDEETADESDEAQEELVESGIVDGRDISETWERRPDQFDFEINDVINAQGFDGTPQVVEQQEFDRAVQESGFIAQRAYSAPDQETLDAYREQLYRGEWYVDCGTGGSTYGKGMYCASMRQSDVPEGEYISREEALTALEREMSGYRNLGESRSGESGVSYTETFTLTPDARIVDWREINDIRMGNLDMSYRTQMIEDIVRERGFTQDEATFIKYNLGTGVEWSDVNAAARRLTPERRDELIEIFDGVGNEATRRYNAEHDRRIAQARILQEKYHDIGSMAAALGYDAIHVPWVGFGCSYTVILNRTKVVFLSP